MANIEMSKNKNEYELHENYNSAETPQQKSWAKKGTKTKNAPHKLSAMKIIMCAIAFFLVFSLLLAWSFQLKLSILIITRFWQKNVGAVRNRISMIISVVKPRSGKLLSLWLLQPLGLVPLKMRDGLTHLIVGLICNLLPLSVQDAYNSHFNLISLNDRRFDPKYRSFI